VQTLLNITNPPSFPYQLYAYNRTALSDRLTLTFMFATYYNRWLLDTVSVEQVWPSSSSNLLINGDFETGNFNGWSRIQSVNASHYQHLYLNGSGGGYYSHQGRYYYYDGTSSGWTGIQQNLSTMMNAIYSIRYFLCNGGGTPSFARITLQWT
jgi:hypothetical protein